jgi:hypothetical protein
LRFSTIAEAKHPTLRALAFELLRGNWTSMIKTVVTTSSPNNSMVFASETDQARASLLRSVSGAIDLHCYVGVGGAYLDGLAMTAVSKAELDHLKASKHADDYYRIHRRIKEVEATHGNDF